MNEPSPYTALALRYRPQQLHEIIGQPALVKTLTAAFQLKKLAHAFLFTGVRGTGKTSTARILAKALNCVGENGAGDMTATPCLDCRFCREIDEKRLLDVIEIDAASHNGVDHIRELIDIIQYQPQSRFRVIILDEVHMLSNPAFNALLKTLEEPPSHTKFIFATTNIEKIPLTIVSRCQRFDLRRVPKDELKNHLQMIAQKEAVPIDEIACDILVKTSEGAVRDCLSLFDRAIALANGATITPDLLHSMLGQTNQQTVIELLQYTLTTKAENALNLARTCYNNGADPQQILMALMDSIHEITMIKIATTSADKTSPVLYNDMLLQLAEQLDMPQLSRLWQILLKGTAELAIAPNTMDALDMILMRVIYAASLSQVPTFTANARGKAVQTQAEPSHPHANPSHPHMAIVHEVFPDAKSL